MEIPNDWLTFDWFWNSVRTMAAFDVSVRFYRRTEDNESFLRAQCIYAIERVLADWENKDECADIYYE